MIIDFKNIRDNNDLDYDIKEAMISTRQEYIINLEQKLKKKIKI